MIVSVDSSVILAELLAERRQPPSELWKEPLSSSRLLEYEVWNRLNALAAGDSHGAAAEDLIRRPDLVELSPVVLERALRPFPTQLRTLDALHLAAALYLHGYRSDLHVATYDKRMSDCAAAVGPPLFPLPP